VRAERRAKSLERAMDVEKLEECLGFLEQYFFSSVSTVTSSFPDVHDAVNRLWIDISRYGPQLPAFPEVHLPSLGDFQIPPPPPPPPPPPKAVSWLENSWGYRHPWKAFALALGATGAGYLLVGYTKACAQRHRVQAHRTRNERRQVVGMYSTI
jgi:hypothetical protein